MNRCVPRRSSTGSAAVAAMCVATVVAASSLAAPPAWAQQRAERCAAPENRQFDFWIGRWEVRDTEGEVVGHNEIRRVSSGCGLLENWRGAGGGTGMSISTYDTDLGRWTQRWVGEGATLWLEGGLEERSEGVRMVLAGTRPRTTPRGDVLDRLVWTPLPDGRVRQLWEISSDGGETWSELFLGLYTRLPEACKNGAAGDGEDSEQAVVRPPEELRWREGRTERRGPRSRSAVVGDGRRRIRAGCLPVRDRPGPGHAEGDRYERGRRG